MDILFSISLGIVSVYIRKKGIQIKSSTPAFDRDKAITIPTKERCIEEVYNFVDDGGHFYHLGEGGVARDVQGDVLSDCGKFV